MKSKKQPIIAFLGSLPPPYGGFSIGLQRIIQGLEEKEFGYVVYDLLNKKTILPGGRIIHIKNRLLWLLQYVFFAKEDLIVCQYIDWRLRTVVGLMTLLGKKTLLSIGGQSLNDAIENSGWLKREIITISLRRYSFIIAHNSVIKQLCLSLGVKENRLARIPSFIPPLVKDEEIKRIPKEIWDFLVSHTPIISSNAFKIVFYKGEDLYGLDMCVDLCKNIKDSWPEIGFVFCLSNIGDLNYLYQIKQKIKEKGIENNFIITSGSFQFYPILMKSDVFVRPTNTDGDAVSLREALYIKVPSVASDVVSRPYGSVLFKTRNLDDFILKVKDLLGNYKQHKQRLEAVEMEDNFKKIIDIYQKLLL